MPRNDVELLDQNDWATLIDSAASGMAVYDHRALLYCSDVYARLFGYETVAAFAKAVAEGDCALPEPSSASGGAGEDEKFELRICRENGEFSWLEFHRRPRLWCGRSVQIVTAYDITGHRLSEQSHQNSENLLRNLLNASPALIGLVNRLGGFEFLNKPLADILGISPDHLPQVSFVGAASDQSGFLDADALAMALGGQQVTLQSEVKDKFGRSMVFECHYRPRFCEDGASGDYNDGAYLVAFDVSERVEAANALRASEERFRKLIELIPLGVVRVDLEGRVRLSNIAYDSMLGYEPGEFHATRIWEIFLSEDQEQKREAFLTALRVAPYLTYGRCKRKDGQIIDVTINWTQEYDELGGVRGLIIVLNDATTDLLARRELQAAKDAAERATLEKSRFLAAASHDLQQPLHSLSIMLGLLAGQTDETRRQEIVRLMERAIEGARALVRGVIDISKLEAGVVMPRMETLPLSDIFDQIEAELAPLTEGRPVDLRIVRSTAWVRSDRLLLRSILHNLVSNAIRYTPRGKILVGVRRCKSFMRIQVWDSGKGIPSERLKDIFKEFTRLERGEGEDQSPGLGLGLSIVERSCTLLGHKLDVKSEPGKGSVFSVDVPFVYSCNRKAAETVTHISGNYQQLHGFILLIEDNPLTAQACRQLVESWGNRCMVALCEDDALQIIRSADKQPDLILADYNLGEMENGIRTIDRILAILGHHIPSILMTANDSPECQEAARVRGIPIIHKPANPARLRALLSYCLMSG
ncbi:PAS domain-containing hybrid sensor histidine kinase/response regulator [Govanella unica]|uniref:histidine kinase n=1 Tax=Govanella unica TaxID=2975056 RepID=A0A9X3TYZ4_9PROT|nr:PAS domain S-box protein [Govania unica]MDA5194292.1 PAS domain S-box protein [Govania unica]